MIELAVVCGLLIAAYVLFAVIAVRFVAKQDAAHLNAMRVAEMQWAEERRELLNRIQRPEMVPQRVSDPLTLPDPEPDEIELVGTHFYDPDLSLDEYDEVGSDG